MKSLHFCTPIKLEEIRKNNEFYTFRTGWIPQIYKDDKLIINHRTTKKAPHNDHFMCYAQCISCIPILFKDIIKTDNNQEEIDRYDKKFHPDQYFFKITFKKVKL